jgi:hypothetical protein
VARHGEVLAAAAACQARAITDAAAQAGAEWLDAGAAGVAAVVLDGSHRAQMSWSRCGRGWAVRLVRVLSAGRAWMRGSRRWLFMGGRGGTGRRGSAGRAGC